MQCNKIKFVNLCPTSTSSQNITPLREKSTTCLDDYRHLIIIRAVLLSDTQVHRSQPPI